MTVSNALDQHPLGREPLREPVVVRSSRQIGTLDWRQALGLGLIALGALAVIIAWFGVSGTLDPAEQMPYISSGGFGGAALIAVGITLLSAYEHARDRAALEQVLDRLDMIEQDIDGIRRGTLMLSPDETSTTNGRTARMARARRQS